MGCVIALTNDDNPGARQNIAGCINHLSIQRGREQSKQRQSDDILLIELDRKALDCLLAKTVLCRSDLVGAGRQVENRVVSRVVSSGRAAISILFILNCDLGFREAMASFIAHQTEERARVV